MNSDNAAQLQAVLQLRRMSGVGDGRCRALIERFGSARSALSALRADGAPEPADNPGWAAAQLRTADSTGTTILTPSCDRYPERLRQIPDPPAHLFVRGDVDLLGRPAVAIVGSRRCSPYGRDVARTFGHDLAARGIAVVSGMALGIDGAAHVGALEVAGHATASTIAVLGSGVDVLYPAAHRALYQDILQHGAIVSELPLGSKPTAGSFPRRNRIVSGLSLGVVVVEAPARSGALITARTAAEQGRDVFAVPGQINNSRCTGCLDLLRDGACLARHVEDVIDEISLPPGTLPPDAVDDPVNPSVQAIGRPAGDAGRLLQLIGDGVDRVDALTRDSGLPPEQILPLMLQLELEGFVQALPGGSWSRRLS